MPPQQGEVSLTTLFADVHYYFSLPTYQPPHHRFDKSSYVYLYHNPMRQSGRIEIANNAGTPAQDAVAGQLESVKIEQSYKHPCLFTLTVEVFRGQHGSPAASPQQDMSQWHLPAADPNNQGKYMYRLHTVDIYLWTQNDAGMFLDSLRRVLQPHQLQIIADPNAISPTAPHHEHKNDTMSPVIANLERAAISHQSRTPSISSTQAFPGPPQAAFPGPPARTSTASPSASQSYTPMAAYNPAAPAAPEPIAHREKTPPPPDAAEGTGLIGAAVHDSQPQQYSNPLQTSFTPQQTSGPYLPGPPAPGQGFSGPPGVQRTNTAGSMPPPPQSIPSFAGPPQSPPSFAGPPQSAPPPEAYSQAPQHPGVQRQSSIPVQQFAGYNGSPGYSAGPQSPGLPSPAPNTPQHYLGYGQHSYESTAQQTPGTNPADLHKQFYRPTEQEAGVVDHHTPHTPNSNMGKRVVKVEKGVGRFLKKLDSKW
ncbi:hypothetical protein N0V91_002447 [Didymella pomorum]|uniref:Uncharacterized protein n=1 Tax=Didymella pomorum TaxID=749634 RepID=A0A9W9DA07_9PLEO|nr:hypothetical protein N0V91_002447 [Didymella pomorum]